MALRGPRRNAFYLILLAGLLVIIWASYKSVNSAQTTERPLSDLLAATDAKEVATATFTSEGDRVDWVGTSGTHYRTYLTAGYASRLVDALHQDRVQMSVTPASSNNLILSVILPNVILFLVIGGFMWYMLRQTQRGSRPTS